MTDISETRWCEHGVRPDDDCPYCVISERDEEIERLTAEVSELTRSRDHWRDAFNTRWEGDVEVRLDSDDELDEIVAHGAGVHIEAMYNGKWFAEIGSCRFYIYGALFPLEVDEWDEEKERVSSQQEPSDG